ncbi:MAG: LysM peptidoglycan-binding domain-containing protein [Clostridia bacterium]|nr:LysM peptidoglycan-binding domain-containing protein [Clostridia bacterium]
MKKTPAGLVAHARAQLGLPYWYGTFGQRPTAELADYKRRQYPQQWSVARLERAKANHLNVPRVYDCAGLVKSYWMQADPHTAAKYIQKYDKSAAGLKACCKTKGPISSIPAEPGLLVFIGTRHVGIYDGRGRVIEARGFDHGVVERNLSASTWDAWGRLDWLVHGDAPAPAPVPTPTPPPASGERTHIVQQGETLWALAVRYLGSGHRWPEIQAMNGGIDPKRLRIGMTLQIPDREAKKS